MKLWVYKNVFAVNNDSFFAVKPKGNFLRKEIGIPKNILSLEFRLSKFVLEIIKKRLLLFLRV